MRELYDEFFAVAEDKKISEKVMMTRTVLTIVVMLVCLAAMSISAYAYFSCNVNSNTNTITAANFVTDVSITTIPSNDSSEETPVAVEEVNPLTRKVSLTAGTLYKITIENTGTAETGFCIITAENDEIEQYHTQQIGVDVSQPEATKKSITFQLSVTHDTIVTFSSHWGTSSHYPAFSTRGVDDMSYITDGENVLMNIKGTNNTIPLQQEPIQEVTGDTENAE